MNKNPQHIQRSTNYGASSLEAVPIDWESGKILSALLRVPDMRNVFSWPNVPLILTPNIEVMTVLQRDDGNMYLLNCTTRRLELFGSTDLPPYAILSHTWGDEEVTFRDIVAPDADENVRTMKGYYKLDQSCRQAILDGLSHVWIDTCCIDKNSSAELSEAINSMYRWYQDASVCYTYMVDVPREPASETKYVDDVVDNTASTDSSFRPHHAGSDFCASRWFQRGWTLQELIAPQAIKFYDKSWKSLGTKQTLSTEITSRTGIPQRALTNFRPGNYSVASKMSWAAARETTRIEDRAYSLMGIFDVNMPLIYGEGTKSFMRLQEEIMKVSNDFTIFSWSGQPQAGFGMLADGPECFAGSQRIVSLTPTPWSVSQTFSDQYQLSKNGITGSFQLYHYVLDVFAATVGEYVDDFNWSTGKVQCIFLQQSGENTYRRISLTGKHILSINATEVTRQFGYSTKTILVERHASIDRRISHFPTAVWEPLTAPQPEVVSITPGIPLAASQTGSVPITPGILYPDHSSGTDVDETWVSSHEKCDARVLRIHCPDSENAHGCFLLGSMQGLVLWFHERLLQDGSYEPAVFASRTIPRTARHNEKVSKHHICCEAGCVKLLPRITAPPKFTTKVTRLAGRVAVSALSDRFQWNMARIKQLEARGQEFTIGKTLKIYLNKPQHYAMCCFSNDRSSRRGRLAFPHGLDQTYWVFDYMPKGSGRNWSLDMIVGVPPSASRPNPVQESSDVSTSSKTSSRTLAYGRKD